MRLARQRVRSRIRPRVARPDAISNRHGGRLEIAVTPFLSSKRLRLIDNFLGVFCRIFKTEAQHLKPVTFSPLIESAPIRK